MNADHLKQLFPKASNAFLALNSLPEAPPRPKRRTLSAITISSHENHNHNGKTPSTILECPIGNELLAKKKGEAIHPGIHVVSICSHRQRLLDEDNLATKYFADGLRYSGILPQDSPDVCHFIITQKKVKTKAEQCTVISITYP